MPIPRDEYLAAPDRRALIVSFVQEAGFLSVPDLAGRLGVSQVTVRRDLWVLRGTGEVRVVHGGVSVPHGTMRTSDYVARAELNAAGKARIAMRAAAEIGPRDTIALDAGSTTYRLAAALPESFTGAVVTNSLPVLELLCHRDDVDVFSLGGRLVPTLQAFVGPVAAENAARWHTRTFFLSAHALGPGGVYSNMDVHQSMKSVVMDSAERTVLLADQSKFAASGPVLVCRLDRLAALITDAPPPAELRHALDAAGVRTVVCAEGA